MGFDTSNQILVVDDYRQMRLTVVGILHDMGFPNVVQANSGGDAQRVMQGNHAIAAVVSDWNMPGMTGLKLLEWMRADPHYRNIPFMLVTAETNRENIRSALAAGASEYLCKPFTINTFSSKFWGMVNRRAPASAPAAGEGAGPPARPQSPPLPAAAPLVAPPGSKQPLALTGNQVIGLDAPLDEDLRQSSVLIVDDSPNSIEVIAETLKHDYAIKVAIKGQKALDIAFATPPDIVLLDIMMPDMDGFEVCRQLKANPRTADVPVLFLSSRDQSDDVVRGMDFGAVDYVIKPAEPAILKARLRTHLRLARMMRGLRQQNELLSEAARLREDVERITRHDLKSPLGTILQASERMRTDPSQPDDQRELAQLVQGAVKEALGMVNLSMDLYRMEVGTYRPQLETVALDQLLMQVAREQMDRHAARRVTIGLPELSLDARVEWQLCHTLFSNLVANAVEASPAGGKVAISLRSAAQNCVVAIENRGAIPAAIRPRFLGKYVSHGKPDGSGLGAYSSKLMAEAMGGRIGFDCDDAADLTRLTVTLPAA